MVMRKGTSVRGRLDAGYMRKRGVKSSKTSMKVMKSDEMTRDFEEKIIDWCTFYRRNIHRLVEHYFGIDLHLYQKIMMYLMNLCPVVVLVCSRAIAKSFLTALYACAVCVLYPNSKVTCFVY